MRLNYWGNPDALLASAEDSDGARAVGGNSTGEGGGASGGQATQPPGITEPSLLHFAAAFPENLRNDPALQPFNSAEAVSRAYVETKRMVGGMVKIPAADADTTTKDKFFNQLGRPEKSEGYTHVVPEVPESMREALPEGFVNELEPESLKQAQEMAWEKGYSQEQFQAMIDLNARMGINKGKMTAANDERARAKGRQDLNQEFGATTQRKLDQAASFFAKLGTGQIGGEEHGVKAWEAIEASGLGNNPHVIATFANAADLYTELTGEDTYFSAGEFGGTGPGIAEEIKALIALKMDNKPFDQARLTALGKEKVRREARGIRV